MKKLNELDYSIIESLKSLDKEEFCNKINYYMEEPYSYLFLKTEDKYFVRGITNSGLIYYLERGKEQIISELIKQYDKYLNPPPYDPDDELIPF